MHFNFAIRSISSHIEDFIPTLNCIMDGGITKLIKQLSVFHNVLKTALQHTTYGVVC